MQPFIFLLLSPRRRFWICSSWWTQTLPGNIAIKLHSGEKGNQNFLDPEFWKPVIDDVGGTVVECNTAYDGARNTTEKHRKLMDEHGWSRYFTVDLLDAEGPDLELDIPNGKVIKKEFRRQRFEKLRLHAGAVPLQGTSHGRLLAAH